MKIQFITVAEFGIPSKKSNIITLTNLLWPIIASHTPKSYEIIVQDEYFKPINTDIKSEIVAFSLQTVLTTHSYKLAEKFKKNGSAIIYGGPHIACIQEYEDLKNEPFTYGYADSIVIGEAENIWGELLEDFSKNKLRKIYQNQKTFPLEKYRIPHREVERKRGLIRLYHIEASRGCPYHCTFCINKGIYRMRPLESLINEMESLDNKKLFFVDSNFGKDIVTALKLFKIFKKLKMKWLSSIDANTLLQKDFLERAKDSNCFGLYIGFESLDQLTLQNQNKIHNKTKIYKQSINRAHKLGIPVIGSFMFGFDQDDKNVFKKTIDFCNEVGMMAASFHILVPYPGTPIFDKFKEKNRLLYTNFPSDWEKYTRTNVVFTPKKMSADKLKEGYLWTLKEFYSFRSIYQRILKGKHPFSIQLIIYLFANIAMHFRLKFRKNYLAYA